MTAYRKAKEVQTIVDDLIANIEDHHHLRGVRVEAMFLDKAPTHAGRIVLGRARKVSGLGAVFANTKLHAGNVCEAPRPFFVIEVPEPVWNALDADRRRALVDHELMHCRTERNEDTGEPVLKMRPHDFEEFAAILRRHGLWTAAAQNAAGQVAEQLALAIDDILEHVASYGEQQDADGDEDDDDA